MPYKSNNTNQQSRENHGQPAGEGKSKGTGDKDLGHELDNPETTAEYTQDDADQATTPELRHPNRNTDKPQLDKPAYGGGH
jgi:hypothetical protein